MISISAQKQRRGVVMADSTSLSKRERVSGVELYRIIAAVLICWSHTAQTFVIRYSGVEGVANYFLQFIRNYFGQAGNLIFIICSAYFLVDSRGVKSNKAIKILLDSTFISVLIYLGFLLGGREFSLEECVRQLLPDFFENMWFVPIYVLFYMIHPFLNAAIRGVSERTLLTFCVIVFVFYGFGGLFFDWNLGMSNLAWFVIVYLIVAYFKLYQSDFCNNKKVNAWVFVFSAVLFVALATANYCLHWNVILPLFYSPVFFPLIFSGFNLLRMANFHSKTVNYVASCSLYFYCIHENVLVRDVLRVDFYNYFMSLNPQVAAVYPFLCFVVWLVGGYALSLLYKVLFAPLADFLSRKLAKVFDKAMDFVAARTSNCVAATTAEADTAETAETDLNAR